MLSALELYDRGVVLSNAGKHAAAKRILNEAAERTTEVNLRARILGTLAWVLLDLGAIDEADRLCREALGIRGLREDTRAVLWGQHGVVAMGRGDLNEALRLLTQASKRLDDPVLAGTVAMNRGNTLLELGRSDEALTDFGDAARLLHSAGLRDDAAKATHNQGYAALLSGDLVSALRYMDAARSRAAAASPVDAAIGDVDRAEALFAAGMPFEASAALAAAAAVYRARRLRLRQADAVWRRARSMLYFDPVAAAKLARSAGRLYESHGNEVGALRALAVALRADVAAGGHSQRLLEDLESVTAQLTRHRLREDAGDLRLVAQRVRVRRGGESAAREALRGIRVSSDAPIARRVMSREVRAEAASVLGDDRRVVREAARGLEELAQWQAVFRSVDLQTSTAMHGQALTKAGIAAAFRSRDVRNMFEWSERARSVASHSVVPRPPSDPRTAADLAELRGLRLSGTFGTSEQRREAELRERIRSRQWATTGEGVVAQFASMDEVQSSLGDRTVLLAYLWSGQRLVALVLEQDASRTVELRPDQFGTAERAALFADLDVHAARIDGALGEAVARSVSNRLSALDELLIAPAMSASERLRDGGTRVVVVAPGILAGVPWSMLDGVAGRPLTVPLSATRWLAERGAHDEARSHGPAGFVAGPRVPRADEEVARAASVWTGATVLRGEAATTGAASELAAAVEVFHVTGHGRHAADNPHFSGIELADGPWFGYDIERIERMPSTAIISACELGRSSIGWGHEALGMARTWLHAGARSVIASPVSVNDDDACEVLSAMHARLATGTAPAVALAEATSATGITAPFLSYGAGW